MKDILRSVSYLPIVKWKAGERRALATLHARRRSALVPLFYMPPSGDFDHDSGRRLKPLEHIMKFGQRLHDIWGRRLVFVDAMGIDDDIHQQVLQVHPLTELLGRAHMVGALACPATAMDRSAGYQDAVRRFAERHVELPICVRVTPRDMASDNFAADLQALLNQSGVGPGRVVLILDFISTSTSMVEEVAEALAERLQELPMLFEWLKVVTAFSSFPAELKMKPGETKTFARTDWRVYRRIIERVPVLRPKIVFGDYAVDSTPFPKKLGLAKPSAHLRHTTGDNYLVVKGGQVKQPVGYAAIYPVAERLVEHDEFIGMALCDGDAFIRRLAARDPAVGTGSASTWRWAATDRHFAQVLADIRAFHGVDAEAGAEPKLKTQIELF